MSQWIDALTACRVLLGDPTKEELQSISYDSRKAKAGDLFLCLKGTKLDSHDKIPELIASGVRIFVVEKELEELHLADAERDKLCIVKVENGREALAELSAFYFHYPSREMLMIGITGTKGKTTTASMVRSILEEGGYRTGLIGTTGIDYAGIHEESRNTTPESYTLQETFRKMREKGCTAVVMEASSQGFKMHRTDEILFDYGIFTNIEEDHIGENEHKDFAEYKYYKSCIFKQSKIGLVNRDANFAEEFLENAPCPCYTFALENMADFQAKEIENLRQDDFIGTCFTFLHGEVKERIFNHLPGAYNVYNALAAVSLACLLKIPMEKIKHALSKIKVNGRMEVVLQRDGHTVIVDYAHNAMGMKNLLQTLRSYNPGRLIVVFGCGGNRSKDRRYGMGEVAGEMADFSILTADNSRYEKTEDIIADIDSTLSKKSCAYIAIPDTREAIDYALAHPKRRDLIAVIGKGHEEYNEVNGQLTHFVDREVILEEADKLAEKK